ncbi:MAG TPA: HindVP family restriction endonuclease, partial [Spirochaetales bacterium]|nr:HindVP family restriction endonuclease [Spirochaetales bacterium]
KLPWIRKIFEPVCHDMQDWGNKYEILKKLPKLLDAVDELERGILDLQKPFLLQPIWKTEGKSPYLAANALDIFVWSDLSLSRLFLDAARQNVNSEAVNRQMRSSARMARFFHHVSTSEKVPLIKIYTEMAFGRQTDKEFAVNGRVTKRYMNSSRKIVPAIKREDLTNIILNGGEKKLSPERRFDQTVYFTVASRQ